MIPTVTAWWRSELFIGRRLPLSALSYLTQLLPSILLQVAPGGCITVGENEFEPPGVNAFSVGEGATVVEVVDVVGVDGASSACWLQPAVRAAMPTIAAPPAIRAIWRVRRSDVISRPVCSYIRQHAIGAPVLARHTK